MSKDLLNKVLTRGVVEVYPSPEDLEIALRTPKKLKFYLGIDPTASFLHLGHTIAARKLEQLRQLGCKVVLLIGNFTATMGDPTDKSAARSALTLRQTEINARHYLKLLAPVLDLNDKKNPVEIRRNNEWWGEMQVSEFMGIAQHTTTQRLLERDMFQERIKAGAPIYTHEFLYPLLQGYDSVAMKVDGEIGGNDQTFNMLMGRQLIKEFLHKEKFVITLKMLTDPTGKKMGKSTGNAVPLGATSSDMFGAVMSWPDEMVADAFELLTDIENQQVKQWQKELSPRDLKARLAREIVSIFHDEKKAQKAEEEFDKVFRGGGVPEDVEEIKVKPGKILPVDLLVTTGLAKSNGDARRVIEQGGMKINDKVVQGLDAIKIAQGDVIQRGKRNFVRIG